MKRDDWMLLTLTFLTGLAIGMYVYIAAFKPTYTPETLSNTEAEAGEWSMISRKRSDDYDTGYIQPSFRLLADGSYTYLAGGQSNDALEPREGKVSGSRMRQLRNFDDSLENYIEPSNTGVCASSQGGYDYEYRFTKNGTLLLLDTCNTTLGQNTSLAQVLEGVWAEVEGIGVGGRPRGFSEWAEEWIRSNIGVQ